MPKYVLGPDAVVHLAELEAAIGDERELLAPTLMRSQVLSMLYHSVHEGEMSRAEADRRLAYVRGLRIRLLGDRVLQQVAWTIADQLGWSDTLTAEYLALTQLQADAFITLDDDLARAIEGVIAVAPVEVLS